MNKDIIGNVVSHFHKDLKLFDLKKYYTEFIKNCGDIFVEKPSIIRDYSRFDAVRLYVFENSPVMLVLIKGNTKMTLYYSKKGIVRDLKIHIDGKLVKFETVNTYGMVIIPSIEGFEKLSQADFYIRSSGVIFIKNTANDGYMLRVKPIGGYDGRHYVYRIGQTSYVEIGNYFTEKQATILERYESFSPVSVRVEIDKDTLYYAKLIPLHYARKIRENPAINILFSQNKCP